VTESTENCRFRPPHFRLMPLIQGTPHFSINLILPEDRMGHIFVADSMVYLHSNFRGGSEKNVF